VRQITSLLSMRTPRPTNASRVGRGVKGSRVPFRFGRRRRPSHPRLEGRRRRLGRKAWTLSSPHPPFRSVRSPRPSPLEARRRTRSASSAGASGAASTRCTFWYCRL
jgi:hypothetical protein